MLYAAGWLVGEYCHHLISHQDTLQALVRGMIPSLPPHIQAVYIHSAVKIYTDCGLPDNILGAWSASWRLSSPAQTLRSRKEQGPACSS